MELLANAAVRSPLFLLEFTERSLLQTCPSIISQESSEATDFLTDLTDVIERGKFGNGFFN
ncbi:MAG: hypothetical protein ACMG55_19110 [Microcoleus sp.]